MGELFSILALLLSLAAVVFVMVFGVVTYRHVAGMVRVTMPHPSNPNPLPPHPSPPIPEDAPLDAVMTKPRPYAPQDAARWAKYYLVRRKASTPTADVHGAFSAWCRAHYIAPPSPQQLSHDLGEMGIERGRAYINGVQQRVIIGRALNKQAKPYN